MSICVTKIDRSAGALAALPMQDAADWFDNTPVLSDGERARIGRTNAIKLFGLDGD